jgi:hypothetical protein
MDLNTTASQLRKGRNTSKPSRTRSRNAPSKSTARSANSVLTRQRTSEQQSRESSSLPSTFPTARDTPSSLSVPEPTTEAPLIHSTAFLSALMASSSQPLESPPPSYPRKWRHTCSRMQQPLLSSKKPNARTFAPTSQTRSAILSVCILIYTIKIFTNYLTERVAGSGSRLIYKNWLSKTSLAHRVSLVGWPEDLSYQSNRFRTAQLQFLLEGVQNHEIYYRPMKPGEDTHTANMIAHGYPQDHPIPGVSLRLTAEQDLNDGTLNSDGTLNLENLRRGVLTSIGLNNAGAGEPIRATAANVVSNPAAPVANVVSNAGEPIPATATNVVSNPAAPAANVASNATTAAFSNAHPSLTSSFPSAAIRVGDSGFF